MATITIRTSEQFRRLAHITARNYRGVSLSSQILRLLRREIAEARKERPSLFEQQPLDDLKPIDRTIYRMLTDEGRMTIDCVMAETGLPRERVRASLSRLVKAGFVETIEQGQASEGQPGAKKLLYASLCEK
jgi:hypothetical protein